MSDARLRELQRAAATGDVQARIALLVERVRIGALEPERLRLATYLGDADARAALPDLDLEPVAPSQRLMPWLRGLVPWGKEPAVRAALAAATVVVAAEPEESLEGWPEHVLPSQQLQAGLAWLRCPCAEHLAKAEELVERPVRAKYLAGEATRRALRAVVAQGHPLTPPEKVEEYVATKAARRAAEAAECAAYGVRISPGSLEPRAASVEEVRAAVVATLVPWVLGQADPLLEPLESGAAVQTDPSAPTSPD